MNVAVLAAAGLPAALACRVVTVAATIAAARRPALCRGIALGGSIAASLFSAAAAAQVLLSGQALTGIVARQAASGITFGYAVTPLSAWFLGVLGLIAVPVAIYSVSYFSHAVAPARTAVVGVGWNVLLGSVEMVFVADGAIGFLCAWELMTVATAALVATDYDVRASRRAAYRYLVMSHVGTGCLIAAFLTLGSRAGSLSFTAMLAGDVVAGPLRHALFALFLVGFGVKAGVIPLHVWLPDAHPAAPSSVSALMSAVLITAGLYGLFRMCAFGLGAPDVYWGLTLMALGALSAVLGVLYALAQNDLKRLLAYSTIENAGVIVLGLGAAVMALAYGHGDLAAIAVAASLYHMLNHAVFKGLLFLGAGSVVMTTGTRQIEHHGGLLRRMPWTGLFFLVGAMAISGLPPLNGFASEWLLFQALLREFASIPGLIRLNFPLGGALLALTTALAAACFVKAFGITFLARPRSDAAAGAHEAPVAMLVPQAILAGLCLVLGVVPGFVLHGLEHVIASIRGVQLPASIAPDALTLTLAFGGGVFDRVTPIVFGAVGLVIVAAAAAPALRRAVRRVPTWGCGGTLSSRTEYTATAFSTPLVMIFRAVYRPTQEIESLARVSPYFTQEVRYRTAIEPAFERYVYAPLTRAVLRIAHGMKVLQAGSLHAYLAYVLVLGVLLLLWLGGSM